VAQRHHESVSQLQHLEPAELIDYGVLVYRGDFSLEQAAAALSRAQHDNQLLATGKTRAGPVARP
jgi:hypothetical protein